MEEKEKMENEEQTNKICLFILEDRSVKITFKVNGSVDDEKLLI